MDRPLSFVEIDSVSAQEALRAGMVSHVVPLEELHEFALRLARFAARAADRSDRPVGVAAGQACRQPHDGTMGFSNAIESCFDMHHLGTRVRSRPPRAGPS